MEAPKEQIDAFFHAYEANYNAALEGKDIDLHETMNCFSEQFIESSPVSIICAKNDDTFRENILKGFAFYKKIGTTCMIIQHKEVTQLDDHHAMVKVHWKANYGKGEQGEMMEFDVFYFLRLTDGIRIFAYITGDEQQLLKAHGLV